MADLSTTNLVPDGGKLFDGTFTTTAIIPSKVLENSKNHRERTTLYCKCPTQNGTWIIYDIDEDNNESQIVSISTTAGQLTVYTYDHISHRIYSTFTPAASAGDGSDSVVIRGYVAGMGMRS